MSERRAVKLDEDINDPKTELKTFVFFCTKKTNKDKIPNNRDKKDPKLKFKCKKDSKKILIKLTCSMNHRP